MRTLIIFILISLIFLPGIKAQDIPDKDQQINSAVQAAPQDQRAGATVLGYSATGELVVLRKGTNKLICLADDPRRKGFSAACYPEELEPFMKRGRDLRAEGKSRDEIFKIREKEMKEGKLEIPVNSTLHILYGTDATYSTETKTMENVNYRYVVYIPWATAESTGLPLSPMVNGGPWIMEPGTHRAHIMISPPWPEK
jgi:hypothetical protein